MVVRRQLGVEVPAAPGAGDGVEQMPVRREDDDVVRAGPEPVRQHELRGEVTVRDDAAQFAEPFQIFS